MVLFFGCMDGSSSESIKVKVLTSGFIYDEASFPQCHASTIVETSKGLLAAWFGGTHEKHSDVCIYTSSLEDGQWSVPELVADGIINDTLRYPCWNPVLYKKDNGDVVLYYKVGPNPREWWGLYKVSKDDGKSWSEQMEIPDHFLGPIKNKPERLDGGILLYPTSYETSQEWNIYVEKSDQDLENWRKIEIDNQGFNAIQPTILFHGKGKIQMLCRSKEGKIVETWSEDQGESWSPVQATQLVNNNSGIDAVTLHNGNHLLVCNAIGKGRNKLSVLASNDGKDWKELVLEDQPIGEFSYPAIIEGKDGTAHLTYTYNRRKIKYVHLEIDK
jgi:predicted neuraminidase